MWLKGRASTTFGIDRELHQDDTAGDLPTEEIVSAEDL